MFLAATLYGVGKTFFWPTTLGLVSEQYPRGGALLLNAISGVGMIAVGTLGGPPIGTLQDVDFNRALAAAAPAIHERVAAEKEGLFSKYQFVDKSKLDAAGLTVDQLDKLSALESRTKQHALAKIAVLPVIMCVCYLGLILYFRSRGGYEAEVLTGHAAATRNSPAARLRPVRAELSLRHCECWAAVDRLARRRPRTIVKPTTSRKTDAGSGTANCDAPDGAAAAASRYNAEVGSPIGVVGFVVERTQAVPPDGVVGGVDDAVLVEVAGRGQELLEDAGRVVEVAVLIEQTIAAILPHVQPRGGPGLGVPPEHAHAQTVRHVLRACRPALEDTPAAPLR